MTRESMAPPSERVGAVVGRALPLLSACPQSSLLRACFPGLCPNLLADSPWLPPGCSHSHVLLSNKGTWNHRNWVRPNGQSRIGPVKAVFPGLSGATGPSALPSPQPDPVVHSVVITKAPPRVARQPRWAGSLRPEARQKHGTLQPPPRNSPCL